MLCPFLWFRLQPLAEQELLAAKSQGQPLPSGPILFPDGDFRLTVSEQAGKLRLFIEALGIAIDTYQHRYIGIAHGRDLPSVLAVVRLDEEGEAEAWLEDSAQVRAWLFQPTLLLIEADDA